MTKAISAATHPTARPTIAPVEMSWPRPGLSVALGIERVGVRVGRLAWRVISTRKSGLLNPPTGVVLVAPPLFEPPMAAMMGAGTV